MTGFIPLRNCIVWDNVLSTDHARLQETYVWQNMYTFKYYHWSVLNGEKYSKNPRLFIVQRIPVPPQWPIFKFNLIIKQESYKVFFFFNELGNWGIYSIIIGMLFREWVSHFWCLWVIILVSHVQILGIMKLGKSAHAQL